MKRFILLLLFLRFSIVGFSQNKVSFFSSDKELNAAFEWAKNKALTFAHDDSDPVGFWYEAALPNREAFCMRDVSHQAIGAEILGLSNHNFNMFLKFAQNISREKDYCSWWEINRYNKPAPVDYESDKDFWYNLPANFDVIYNLYRLYNWTGNKEYIVNSSFKNFYTLSLNEYVDHWDLGYNEVENRDRNMHIVKPENGKLRFGNKRGIPTYNEGGRGETHLGIDLTASLIAAYYAYSNILEFNGSTEEAGIYYGKALLEKKFLDEFWWDKKKEKYKSILYADNTFDYFMVGENQAFLHYLLYYNAISDPIKIKALVDDYVLNYNKLIVELKSYLPIILYENGHSEIASKMIVELCSAENKRRDYPENSFTIIEHITRGLMGVNVIAGENSISTISRLENENDFAEMKNIPLLSNKISVKHEGVLKTTIVNQSGPDINWYINVSGYYGSFKVNGKQQKAKYSEKNNCSWLAVKIATGEKITVEAN